MIYFFSFPTGKQPEDTSESLVLLARFFLIFAVGSLIWGASKVPRWVDTLSFKETTGVMKQSDLKGSVFPQYDYEVNGQAYLGVLDDGLGERPLGHYPMDGPVKVYYDPQSPDLSVLHRTPSGNMLTGLIGAVACVYCGIFIWRMA